MSEKQDTIEKLFSRLSKQEENEVLRYAYLIDDLKGVREEIERLNNIIKEVREYIASIKDEDIQYTIGWVKQDILQILDKEENDKEMP